MKDFQKFLGIFKQNLLSKTPSKQIIEWQQEGLLKHHLLLLDRCAGILQDSKYHQDDVFTHCVKTCDNTPPNAILRWAGLLHDTGKYETRDWHILCNLYFPEKRIIQFCRKKGRSCYKTCEHAVERITFYRHEIASERIARKILKRYRVPFAKGQQIVTLVAHHMYNFTSDRIDKNSGAIISAGWSEKALDKFIKNTGLTKKDLETWEDFPLFKLRLADRLSRGLEPITQRQLDFIERLQNHLDRRIS